MHTLLLLLCRAIDQDSDHPGTSLRPRWLAACKSSSSCYVGQSTHLYHLIGWLQIHILLLLLCRAIDTSVPPNWSAADTHPPAPAVQGKRKSELLDKLLAMYPPVLHRWFLARFPEPATWHNARLGFTRTTAVWSMVGHIVGLGDRHGENILLDATTGDAVHVDFAFLFDRVSLACMKLLCRELETCFVPTCPETRPKSDSCLFYDRSLFWGATQRDCIA